MPPLIRALTSTGVGPRRACFQLIVQGKVTVNGEVVTNATSEVDLAVDSVIADGHRVGATERHVYLKVHKPPGVLSAVHDARGRATVTGLVPPAFRHLRLFPVGRLDVDSTGLVLMTNDGDLAYRLMHPSYGYEKEYHALLRSPLTAADITALSEGVLLDGQRTAPARVARVRHRPGLWYSVTLQEGRKRQVRRMLITLGNPSQTLERVRIHTLLLGNLAPGKAAELTAAELASLRGEAENHMRDEARRVTPRRG